MRLAGACRSTWELPLGCCGGVWLWAVGVCWLSSSGKVEIEEQEFPEKTRDSRHAGGRCYYRRRRQTSDSMLPVSLHGDTKLSLSTLDADPFSSCPSRRTYV